MKKFRSLLEVYKFNKKWLISMPILALGCVVAAIVFLVKFTWWLGLIFFGLAIYIVVLYLVLRRYYDKKIKELEKEEALNNSINNN